MPEGAPDRRVCDVVILATARSSSPISDRLVTFRAPGVERSLQVKGDRRAVGSTGSLSFTPAEPWTEMPLGWDRAYGGVDQGIVVPSSSQQPNFFDTVAAHPGSYPRNDIGLGFRVAGSNLRLDGTPLPNIEDPADLLTPSRLVCPRRAAWHRQPRPIAFGYVMPHWFERSIHFGVVSGIWPDASCGPVPEETLGLIPRGFVERQKAATQDPHLSPGFFQVAGSGLTLSEPSGRERIELQGLDAHPILVDLPGGRPTIRLRLRQGGGDPASRLQQVLLDFDNGVLTMLWSASLPLQEAMSGGMKETDLREMKLDAI
jgi:hypothetical protein